MWWGPAEAAHDDRLAGLQRRLAGLRGQEVQVPPTTNHLECDALPLDTQPLTRHAKRVWVCRLTWLTSTCANVRPAPSVFGSGRSKSDRHHSVEGRGSAPSSKGWVDRIATELFSVRTCRGVRIGIVQRLVGSGPRQCPVLQGMLVRERGSAALDVKEEGGHECRLTACCCAVLVSQVSQTCLLFLRLEVRPWPLSLLPHCVGKNPCNTANLPWLTPCPALPCPPYSNRRSTHATTTCSSCTWASSTPPRRPRPPSSNSSRAGRPYRHPWSRSASPH